MGDILHALPAVTALRQAHPGWRIDWVVDPRWRALLAAPLSSGRTQGARSAQPLVDHLHFAPTKEWRKALLSRKTFHEIQSLRSTIKASTYDVSIDLQGAVRSAILGNMAGCRRLIGEASPREKAASWFFTEHIPTHGAHVIEQDVELACAIAGDELSPVLPWLPVDGASEAQAEQILFSSKNQPAVLINPGAGWGAKRWPVERYATVAQGMIERGFRVLVNVGPGEEPLAQAIVEGTAGQAIALNASLDLLIAVSRRISLLIAGDTGPLHLACALGRPVVGIYGPTDPSRNGPYGSTFKVLRSPASRRDHTRHSAPEAGLLTIQPEQVLRAVDELLYPVTKPGNEKAAVNAL